MAVCAEYAGRGSGCGVAMWRFVTVLGLWLCCAGAVAGQAEFRFQALVDRDQSALTGCDVDGPLGTVHGKELRIYTETDRTQVLRVVAEQCESGQWHQVGLDENPKPLGLGQGTLASDIIEWEMPRDWLAGAQVLQLQLWGQHLQSGAFDFVGGSDGSGQLLVPLGAVNEPIPATGRLALVLLAGGAALIALRFEAARRRRAILPLLVLVGVALCAIVPIRDSQAGLGAKPITLVDPANDSVGKDAGVDFVGASIRLGSVITFRVEVNNIKADGLVDGAKVLFIGNSLTYAHDLPAMLTAVAAQAGKTLVTGEVTEPDFSLADHYRLGRAQAEIAKGYQLVILQQGPSALEESQLDLKKWSLRFDPIIRSSGARPALYMVWPELARFGVFSAVRESYSNAADAIGGMFIPGGEAWRASWRVDPALKLYGDDDFHPSTLGTYAIAVSMFAELFRQMPDNLPATFTLANGRQIVLDPAQVRIVQQGAWQAHLDFGRAGR